LPQPPPTAAQGPGEYTRMFMAPTVQQAPPRPVAAPPAAQSAPARNAQAVRRPAKKKPSYVPLLIVLGLVFLMALTLVLFFALRK
jgi:hypothetical protein